MAVTCCTSEQDGNKAGRRLTPRAQECQSAVDHCKDGKNGHHDNLRVGGELLQLGHHIIRYAKAWRYPDLLIQS